MFERQTLVSLKRLQSFDIVFQVTGFRVSSLASFKLAQESHSVEDLR
jgi:hypothetical protein